MIGEKKDLERFLCEAKSNLQDITGMPRISLHFTKSVQVENSDGGVRFCDDRTELTASCSDHDAFQVWLTPVDIGDYELRGSAPIDTVSVSKGDTRLPYTITRKDSAGENVFQMDRIGELKKLMEDVMKQNGVEDLEVPLAVTYSDSLGSLYTSEATLFHFIGGCPRIEAVSIKRLPKVLLPPHEN